MCARLATPAVEANGVVGGAKTKGNIMTPSTQQTAKPLNADLLRKLDAWWRAAN